MSRLHLAVDEGGESRAAAAAVEWRKAARLAGRLECQGLAIADKLEHSR